MNCREVDKYLFEYCEANLSPELTQLVEEHLIHCKSCSNLVRLTQMENDALKNLPAFDFPDDVFTDRVMKAVSARQAIQVMNDRKLLNIPRTSKIFLFTAAAAAVVLLITGVLPDFYNTFNMGRYAQQQYEVADSTTTDNNEININSIDAELSSKESAVGQIEADTVNGSGEDTNTGINEDSTVVNNREIAAGSYNTNSSNDTHSDSGGFSSPPAENEFMIAMAETDDTGSSDTAKIAQTDMTYSRADSSAPTINRYRTYAVSLPKNEQNICLQPINMPDNYVLSKSPAPDSAVFVYTDVNTNKAIEISIEPYHVLSATANAEDAVEIPAIDEDDEPEGPRMTTSVSEPAPASQELTVIVEYEENQYLIKLNSSLNNEELQSLAKSLELGQL